MIIKNWDYPFFEDDLRAEDFFFPELEEDEAVGEGTLAPDLRASLNPIAMACFRLFTFPPFPSLPDFNLPSLYSCITSSTLSCAFFEYFVMRFCFMVCRQSTKPDLMQSFILILSVCYRLREKD